MESPKKKLKSPGIDLPTNINIKNSITCSNVPESLFDSAAVKKHLSKFGKVQKIRLFPRRQMCIIEYDQPMSVERAVLNAGAYDGFMFEVTRTKARMRRKSKKDDDPDWVPDSDVVDELSAMSETPIYRVTRQKPMELESPDKSPVVVKRTIKKLPIRTKPPIREKPSVAQQILSAEPQVVVPTQTSMSTVEAAAELQQLRSKVSLSPDEQWRILDARDRILRAWGGAGSRVKIGGATIGTCSDMCPEKELLHRQAEHQTMTLETVVDSDGVMEPWRAVKQYSRSSADQEIPMCYELRPAPVLMQTCSYLLHEIADTTRQVSLADWFHFMWDRFRGIRKDITQQALCCADSIALVEMCARFHAHCAARLADLEHTQFDQKLNTDNLTKCLQTLKHMYADVGPELKPREAEFRGYIALLNLGDANFWWEIKQLPREIQKSEPITLAMKVFNALDNNNYVKFFRLVRERATYLQACILLRYFNDVRARALARIVRAFAARGGSKYPAEELMNTLSFESIESMRSFITHYGLRFGRDETDLSIILDRNQFTEDSDPFPIARAIKLIESKRQCSVGEVIAGGMMPQYNRNRSLYTSFNKDGRLKETALIAEDQGYNTQNDSNKDVGALKSEIRRLAAGGRVFASVERPIEPAQPAVFSIPDVKTFNSSKPTNVFVTKVSNEATKSFSFKPAIPVASSDIIKKSPDKTFDANKNIFSFSKPQNTEPNNIFTSKDTSNLFKATNTKSIFTSQTVTDKGNLFTKSSNENTDPSSIFKKPDDINVFKSTNTAKSVFSRLGSDSNNSDLSKNVFASAVTQNTKPVFGQAKEGNATENETPSNIFGKAVHSQTSDSKNPSVVFGSFNKSNALATSNNLFTNHSQNQAKPSFAANGDISPGTLFKTAISAEGKTYSIFQSKNRGSTVADNISSSVTSDDVYGFKDTIEEKEEEIAKKQRLEEERIQLEMERKIQEEFKREEERKRQEEEKRKQEERRKQEELRRIEEKRRQDEEKRQEELRKKMEEERKAELKRQAEEKERQFKERVNNESQILVKELEYEVVNDTITSMISEESKKLKDLNLEAFRLSEEIWKELSDEITHSEIKAEKIWTDKLKKKWVQVWKNQFYRNFKRRSLLEDTPVWLTERTSVEEAGRLRRSVEYAALKHMNSIHRGYKFSGELRQFPSPKPYDIVEIIRSPLLKRMKAINYPYDKCFFWKVTLVSPEPTNYIARKIEIYKWLLDVFSDEKAYEISETVLQVKKQTWNHLMDFAVSVSIASPGRKHTYSEAIDGTNGILFYTSDNDKNIEQTIDEMIKQKYPYQIIPVAVVLSTSMSETEKTTIEKKLLHYAETKVISCYRVFNLEQQNVHESLNAVTKSALKWLSKKCPQNPPIEVDHLKSICQRYLGNEIWYRFKSERDGRMNIVLKDLYKLVQCYNVAVDKLIDAVTNENLFNYSPFPLEFHEFLDHTSLYPKPYEFIPTNARNSDNVSAIRDLMTKLKLPNPASQLQPIDVGTMQANIRKYCNQIGWFENPEEVVCKVVAKLPTQFSDIDMPHEDFSQYFERYDVIDFLNIIVYEKINRMHNFDNRYAIYEKNALKQYQSMDWIYDTEVFLRMKHKVLEEDICELEDFIQAKRRKIALDSMEYLALEDSDCTMVEENIKAANESISKYSNCKEAVKQLEEQIEIERTKAQALENLLQSALSNV